jgi:hypothetical protein
MEMLSHDRKERKQHPKAVALNLSELQIQLEACYISTPSPPPISDSAGLR